METKAKIARLLEATTVVLLIVVSIALTLSLSRVQPAGLDFAPVFAAASNPSHAYDIASVTQAQSEMFGLQLSPRPFAYPPTALLLFSPLGSIPFLLAFVIFVGLAYVSFAAAAIRAGAPWWANVSPPVILLVYVGQPTLVVGAILLIAFCFTDWRWRGILFGVAIALKPQLCLFLPLLMLFRAEWRSLFLAGAVVGGLAAGATLVFGLPVWQQWFHAAGGLLSVVDSNPTLAANTLQTNPILFAIPAFVLVWIIRKSDVPTRFGGMIGAALLVSPYAMNYELALLAPAVAAGARAHPWMMIPMLILGLGFFQFEMTVLLVALLSIVWQAVNLQRRRSESLGHEVAASTPAA